MLTNSSFKYLVSAIATQLANHAFKFKHLIQVDPAAALSDATFLHVCSELGLESGVSEETEERAVVINVELVGEDFVLCSIGFFVVDGVNAEHIESYGHFDGVVDVLTDGCWIGLGVGAIEVAVHDSEVVEFRDSTLDTTAEFEHIEF